MNAQVINVVSATLVGPYRLQLVFDDGIVKEVDFGPFLSRARHPEIRAFLDVARFGTFHIEHGELIWGDYELCFPVIDLYTNQIEKHACMQAVA